MSRRPVTHLRVETETGRVTLWCEEHTEVDASSNYDTTDDPTKVTCRRCIAAGACGPKWKP